MNYSDLLSKIDIVDVISQYFKVVKASSDYKIVCPFHADKDPSLNISSKKQIFKCFVCNIGGNAINFVEKHLKISYSSAANLIAKNFDINWKHADDANFETHKLSDQQLQIVLANEEALKLFKYNIFDTNNKQLQLFLKQRQLNNEILNYFQLGYSNGQDLVDYFKNKNSISQILLSQIGLLSSNLQSAFFNNRIIFPIFNQYKELVGFSGRVIEKDEQLSKYINSPESKVFSKQKILFNLNNAWDIIKEKKEIIICEGFMDVIALYRVGYYNAVALMGTTLSNDHLNIFKLGNVKINVILFLDADAAGLSAMIKSIHKLISNNFQTYIIKNTTKLDPDEIFIQKGSSELKKILLQKEHAIHFYYEQMVSNIDQESINNFDYLKKIALMFSPILNKYEKDIQNIYIIKLTKLFNQDKSTIEELFKFNNTQIIEKQKNISKFVEFKNNPSKKIDKSIEMRYLSSVYHIIKLYLENKSIEENTTINLDFNIYDVILDKINIIFKDYFNIITNSQNINKIDFDQYIINSLNNNVKYISIFKEIQNKYFEEKTNKLNVYIARTSKELEELQLKIKTFYEVVNEENWIKNIKNQKDENIKEKSSQSFLTYSKSKK